MSEHSDLLAEAGTIQWEREVRGYNRQQVDEYVAWRTGQVRDLESKLSQSLAEIEHLRREVTEAREATARPAHEEISERVGQILKLAADEAKAERDRSTAEISALKEAASRDAEQLRADVKRETDQIRSDAQTQAERMLTAARDEAERTVSAARADAEQMTGSATAAAERMVAEANEHAESTVATALAQAKQQLDEATARATAIHDGAERRLNLLISRHTETVRRLTEIRDVVTNLVAGETARGSLEDEVARALTGQAPAIESRAGGRRPGLPGEPPAAIAAAGPGAPARSADHADPLTADPLTAERLDGDGYDGRADGAQLPIEASIKADEARADTAARPDSVPTVARHG